VERPPNLPDESAPDAGRSALASVFEDAHKGAPEVTAAIGGAYDKSIRTASPDFSGYSRSVDAAVSDQATDSSAEPVDAVETRDKGSSTAWPGVSVRSWVEVNDGTLSSNQASSEPMPEPLNIITVSPAVARLGGDFRQPGHDAESRKPCSRNAMRNCVDGRASRLRRAIRRGTGLTAIAAINWLRPVT
jgi:hypothetical protein